MPLCPRPPAAAPPPRHSADNQRVTEFSAGAGRDVDQLGAALWGVNSAGDGGGTLESDDAERPAASHLRLVVR
jgi:hypothetical protein